MRPGPEWFRQFYESNNIPRIAGYDWWSAFCLSTGRPGLKTSQATEVDREAFMEWLKDVNERPSDPAPDKVRDPAPAKVRIPLTATLPDVCAALFRWRLANRTARGEEVPRTERGLWLEMRALASELEKELTSRAAGAGSLVDRAFAKIDAGAEAEDSSGRTVAADSEASRPPVPN